MECQITGKHRGRSSGEWWTFVLENNDLAKY